MGRARYFERCQFSNRKFSRENRIRPRLNVFVKSESFDGFSLYLAYFHCKRENRASKRGMGTSLEEKDRGDDQRRRRRRKKTKEDRPPPLVDTGERACKREKYRGGGGGGGRGRRRRRRRHSGLLLQALVRGGGRLGRLEGVPFQTLRIDLFVDGSSSLHPLLVVVDHVLKLFQRFSTGSLLSLSLFSFLPPLLCPGTRLPLGGNRSFLPKHLSNNRAPGKRYPCTFDPLTIDVSTPISILPPPKGGETHRTEGGKGKDRS